MSETTVTNAVTPTIMPSSVSPERSLCAQIAAAATLRISISFTGSYYEYPKDLVTLCTLYFVLCASCFIWLFQILDVHRTSKYRSTKYRAQCTKYSYSYLRDSIGSNRAAFHAGHKPKTIPTAAEMPTPIPIAQAGTYAGSGEYLLVKKLASSPTARPKRP